MAATPVPTPEPAKPPPSWLATLLSNHAALLALAAGLGGAAQPVWTELKAWRLGVASNKIQLAEEQNRLWTANIECIQRASHWEIDGENGLVVRVTLCPTGDALLRYYQNDAVAQFRWAARPPPPPRKP